MKIDKSNNLVLSINLCDYLEIESLDLLSALRSRN